MEHNSTPHVAILGFYGALFIFILLALARTYEQYREARAAGNMWMVEHHRDELRLGVRLLACMGTIMVAYCALVGVDMQFLQIIHFF